MTDRPILFSGPMVRALLERRKTQTRRGIVLRQYRGFSEFGQSDTAGYDWHLRDSGKRWHDLRHAELLELLPYHVGDHLYVREAWHAARSLNAVRPRDIPLDADIEYAATARNYAEIGLKGKLRPGMFMPRWASRLTLVVTGVKVERLKDISCTDAIAEGVPTSMEGNAGDEIYCPKCDGNGVHGAFSTNYGVTEVDCSDCTTARDRFKNLWRHINGPGSWDANPWVVAVSFEVHQSNIDAMKVVA